MFDTYRTVHLLGCRPRVIAPGLLPQGYYLWGYPWATARFSIYGSKYMTADAREPRPVSLMWQFVCLLAPVVMTGFYLVYALVGLVIDGPEKIKWSDEALQVGALVAMIIVAINLLVILYALFHRLRLSHLLWISPLTHIAIALGLTALIAVLVGSPG